MTDAAPGVADHLSTVLGEAGDALQEILPVDPRVDLVSYPPTEARPVWTLVTSGMSARDMNVPPGLNAPGRAELVMSFTPREMERIRNMAQDATGLALVNTLRWLARFPYRADTFFDRGHSVPMPDEFDLGDLSRYMGVLLAEPMTWAREATTVGGVQFLAVYPLLPEESAVAKQDPGRLLQMMWDRGMTEVFNPDRASLFATPPVAKAPPAPPKKKKRLFGLLP